MINLSDVKKALQITSTTLDDELTTLIDAAILDMGIAGVDKDISTATDDPLVKRAVTAYVGYQFNLTHGSMDRSKAFKVSYDEMKAQMGMSSSYTVYASEE